MELCMLPNTGADAGIWAFAIVAAIAAIVLGAVMLRRGGSRRRVGMGMAALAAIGIVALGSVGAAPSAFADSGARDCVTQTPATPAPPAAAPVTPQFPTVAAQCGVDSIVTAPTQTGVVYTQTRSGSVVTVTAAAAPGFVIPAGVQSAFQYDVTPAALAPWPVVLPERIATTLAGGGELETYLLPEDPALVPALQSAQDAGQLTYALEGDQFGYRVPIDVRDSETDEVIAVEQVVVRLPTDVSYDFVEGVYVLTIDEAQDPTADIQAQLDAIQARYPDAELVPRFDGGLPELSGLQLVASYVPAPACDPVTVTVPIDVEFPVIEAPASRVAGDAGLSAAVADASQAIDSAIAVSQAASSGSSAELPAVEPTAPVIEPTDVPATDETVAPAEEPTAD